MAYTNKNRGRLAMLLLAFLAFVPRGGLAGGEPFTSAPPYECTSLKLTAACGLPDGPKHSYALEGVCNYWDGQVKKNVWVKVQGVYKPSDHSAAEAVSVEGAGKMQAIFKCNEDPWVTQTVCAVQAFSADSSVMETFMGPYYSEKQPFARKYVSSSTALQMSQGCSQNPPPPPPPPPAKKPTLQINPETMRPIKPPESHIDPGQLRPKPIGEGDGEGSQGAPEVPQISKPTNNFATCGSVPVDIHAGGATTALEVVFEYHTPNCGTGPSCWNAKSIAGVPSPVASASWTTQIPRSAFPSKGEWRLRARGLVQPSTSSWSNWRDFRVKRNSECP